MGGSKAGTRRATSGIFNMVMANVTSWSSKAKGFFLDGRAHAFAAVETHWKRGTEEGHMAELIREGWIPSAALPLPSVGSESGNYGGVVVAKRSNQVGALWRLTGGVGRDG